MESVTEADSKNLVVEPKRGQLKREDAVTDSPLSDSTGSSGIEKDTPGDGEESVTFESSSVSSHDVELSKHDDYAADKTIVVGSPNDGVKFSGLEDNDSIFSSEDSEDDSESKPNIPDGGWGWVVVLSSFIISMIADGISFSFGLLYIEFLDEFQASKSTTAWIGSLFIAVPLLSGPIMSALVDRYGCRSMTMLGGIVSTFGFILASISNSLEMMLITFGVIAGLGLGLVYVTAVVAIAYWFDKKRTLAVGLGACGTGVGTFVYAPMTQYFIQEYGWRGTILLLSGTLLNLCVCGAVMRDPEWLIAEHKRQAKGRSKDSSSISISGRSGGGESIYPGIEELKILMKSGHPPDYILTQLATSIQVAEHLESTTKMNANMRAKGNSVIHLPTYLKQSEKVPIEVLETLTGNKKLYNIILVNYPSLLNSYKSSSEHKLPTESFDEPKNPPAVSVKLKALARDKTTEKDEHGHRSIEDCRALKKQDSKGERREWLRKRLSVNYHYLKDLRMPRNSIMHRNAMLNISKYRLRASSCPNIYKNSMITINEKEEKWYAECFSCMSGLFDVSLYTKFHFVLLSLSTIILFTWFIVPYFYLVEHLTQIGYSEDDGAFILSIVGITNTIGMIGLGWIGDRPCVNVGALYSACLVLCGMCVATMPPASLNLIVLAVISAVFGLLFAGAFTFIPSLLVGLVPLEDFTSAYGLVLFGQGVGHLIGPPLSGLLFDLTKTWELSFYLGGGWIAFAGILVLVIPFTKNFKICSSKSQNSDTDSIA